MTNNLTDLGGSKDIPIPFLNDRARWDHFIKTTDIISTNEVDQWIAQYDYSTSDSVNTLFPLTELCCKLLWSTQYKTLNHLLKVFPYQQSTPVVCVTILRSSSSGREKLSEWNRAVVIVQQHLNELGLNAQQILAGLL